MPAATTVSEMYMAAKKTPKKPTPNKSDFIRSQPTSMSAAEIVVKAKAAGINFAPVLVYKVRGRAKTKKAGTKTAPAIVTTAPMTSATKPAKSKSAFIRSLPSTTPAKEVVKQAKAAGIKLNVGYVYNVRQAAKKVAKSQRAAGSPTVGKVVNGGGSSVSSSTENLLKAVAAEIGLGPAIEILQGERARVAAVIGG
jgi:outer membrane PBP1 activator LpoA protein